MKSQSSQYRTKICGLPPKLAFSPKTSCLSPSSSSATDTDRGDDDNDGGDNDDDMQYQQQEKMKLWKNQLHEEEIWKNAQTNTRCLICDITTSKLKQHDDDSNSKKISDELIQLYGRRLLVLNHDDDDDATTPIWLTTYDVEKISQIFQDHLPFDNAIIHEFIQNSKRSVSDTVMKHIQQKEMQLGSWYELLITPFKDAANEILKMYDKDLSSSSTQQYLHYRAIRTMEQVQHFTLPYQKRQLLLLKEYSARQQQIVQELERCYNESFEKLDDYCMNVLGVESDTLPLFPEIQHGQQHQGKMNCSDNVEQIINEYSYQVGNHVQKIMMNELEELATKFLVFLDDKRLVLSHAIQYYRHFTNFLSSSQWKRTKRIDNAAGESSTSEILLPTLQQFATSSSEGNSRLSQFIQSPSMRYTLVTELQQLDAFLVARQRELSSRIGGAGRDVANAINLAWIQCNASSDHVTFNDVTMNDISQYRSTVQSVLLQITGDGFHAKRLRLLADALGHPLDADDEDFCRFKRLCLRAAEFAYKMALYQSQQEASAVSMEYCKADIELSEEEIRLDACRLDGLIELTSN